MPSCNWKMMKKKTRIIEGGQKKLTFHEFDVVNPHTPKDFLSGYKEIIKNET